MKFLNNIDGASKILEDAAHRFVSDTEKNTWNAKQNALGTGTTSQYLRGDGIWATPPNTTYGLATTSTNGLMSSTDKTKLNGVATGANNYTHPSSHPATMITEDSSHRFVTDAEKADWNAAATFEELYNFQQHVAETYVERSGLLDMVYPVGSIYLTMDRMNPGVLLGGTWTQILDRFLLASGYQNQDEGITGGSFSKTITAANLPSHSHTINHTHDSSFTGTTNIDHTHSVSGTTGSGGKAHTHSVSGTTGNNSVGHTHSVSGTTGSGGRAHTHSIPSLSGTAASAGGHDHSVRYKGFALTATSSGWFVLRRNQSGDSYDGTDSNAAMYDGAHTHSVSTNASTTGGASAYSHTHSFSATSGSQSANHTHSFSVTSGGASAYSHTHSFSATSGTMSDYSSHAHTLNVPAYTGSSGSTGSGSALDITPPYISVHVWQRIA